MILHQRAEENKVNAYALNNVTEEWYKARDRNSGIKLREEVIILS
jgi:hypothetical protein